MTDRKLRRSTRRKAKPADVEAQPVAGEAGEWVPEFPGQRPPFQPGNDLAREQWFEPGNEVSLRHGGYSPRKVDPIARELAEDARSHTPHLAAPQWAAALWAWARAEAQTQLLTEYLSRAAESTGDGVGDLADEKVRAAYLLLHRSEARADRGRARLGLDPLSAARLGRDRAAASLDVARVMQELERREGESGGGS